jgi:hypothetical protein
LKNGKTRIFAGAGAAPPPARVSRCVEDCSICTAGDDRWEALSAGLPQNAEVHVILVHPSDPDVVFVGTQDGLYRSTGGGDHWQRLGFPDRGVMIWALTLHPTRPNVMYGSDRQVRAVL